MKIRKQFTKMIGQDESENLSKNKTFDLKSTEVTTNEYLKVRE